MGFRLSSQCSSSQASFVTRLTWENYRGKTWPEVWAEAFMSLVPLMVRTVLEQKAPIDEITVHFSLDRCVDAEDVVAQILAGDRMVNEIVAVLPEPVVAHKP